MNTSVCLVTTNPYRNRHIKQMGSPNEYNSNNSNNVWQLPLLYQQTSHRRSGKDTDLNNAQRHHGAMFTRPNPAAGTPDNSYEDMLISNKVTLEDVMFQNERHGSDSKSDRYTVTDSCHSGTPDLQADTKSPESESSKFNSKRSKRSRNGCLTCRYRKKRCCETKPACNECSRLGLACKWPVPGTENRNRSKNNRTSRDEMDHEIYGTIKILRGIVAYKSDE